MTEEKKEGALSGYRVLDLTDGRGTYCTRLLADMGAEVIKIEKPGGGSARSIPPFAGNMPHKEKSLFFLYRNTNKKGITLNLENPDGKAILKKLVTSVDVLVESFDPGFMKDCGLGYETLKAINPGLVMASITGFGQDGPYKDWKGSNIVDFALSGAMIGSGFGDGKPTALPGSPGDDAASVFAGVSIITALYVRGESSEGQYIDASAYKASRHFLYPWGLVMWHSNYEPDKPLPGPEGRLGAAVYPVFPCKDGYIRVVALTPRQWEALLRVVGEPEVLCMDEWKEFYYRIGNADVLFALMTEFTAAYTMEELTEMGHKEGVPIAPIYDTSGFANSPQTKSRNFFVELDHPVIGKYKCPSPPYKWSVSQCAVTLPAPCVGEHNETIFCDELGYSNIELSALRFAGVI